MSTLSSIVVPASQWPQRSSVSACQSCGKAFGIFNQREHCQCCGRVCCASTCLENRVVLPGHSGSAPVPVCDACASAVRRVRQDAEVAIERCHILEQLLNEQTLQSEKLMGQFKALRVENEFLLKDKDRLTAQLKKMEIELEVAAARAALKDSAASPSASPAASPTFGSAPGAPSTDTNLSVVPSDQLSAFEKKKKQLDLREATLQEALKKVSNDAAKLVSQRTALQERERQYKDTLTKQFEHVFSEERAAWESLYTRQTDDLAAQFRDWLTTSSSASAQAPGSSEPTPASAATAAAAAPDTEAVVTAAVQEALASAQQEHAAAMDDLHRELDDYKREVAALNERLVTATTAAQAQQTHAAREEVEAVKRDVRAQLDKEKQRWSDDRLILENTITALKHSLEDANSSRDAQQSEALTAALNQADTLRQQVADLESANKELAESSEQKLRHVMAQVSEVHRVTSNEVAQLEARLREATSSGAAELEASEAAHKAQIAELQRALEAAEASGATAHDDRAEAAASTAAALHEQATAHAQALADLNASHAAKTAQLIAEQQGAIAEAEQKHQARVARLEAQLAEAQAAVEAANAHAQQRTAEADEARTAVAQASATPPAMRELYGVFLEDTRLAQRVMLTEYAQAIYTAKETLTAMATRSLRTRQEEQASAAENEQKLKRQLAGAKRQSKEYEARAEEQARDALQNKRDATAAKEELAQVKEKFRRLQQQQRNQNVNSSTLSSSSAGATRGRGGGASAPRTSPSRAGSAPNPNDENGGGGGDDGSVVASEALAQHVLEWAEDRQELLTVYVEVMLRGPLADLSDLSGTGLVAMMEEVEKRREQSRRNALALERTTSTIKDLQQDLRLRTDRVEQRELALVDAEAKLKAKKERILVLCRSLSTVTQKLRAKEVALSQEEAEAEATAAREVLELDTSPARTS